MSISPVGIAGLYAKSSHISNSTRVAVLLCRPAIVAFWLSSSQYLDDSRHRHRFAAASEFIP